MFYMVEDKHMGLAMGENLSSTTEKLYEFFNCLKHQFLLFKKFRVWYLSLRFVVFLKKMHLST